MEPLSQQTQQTDDALPNLDLDDELSLNELYTLDIPPLPEPPPQPYNEVNEKQLRSALVGACKRMPRNAEAHFHLGLMYLRKCDGDEALHAFDHCRRIYHERIQQYEASKVSPPPHLEALLARLRIHSAQAAHLALQTNPLPPEKRANVIERLQSDFTAAADLDPTQLETWNALALLHLLEGGSAGAKQLLGALHNGIPEYMDALSNLALAELAVGDVSAAILATQKVLLYDRSHAECLTNYGILLLQTTFFTAANNVLTMASRQPSCSSMAATWGALAVSRAALGDLPGALSAAADAERLAAPVHRSRFALLHASMSARVAAERLPDVEARTMLDAAILKLRALTRELRTASAHAALALALRVRHDHVKDETGNRNFGAEAAERLVEALELDEADGAAWTQLALLQMWTGDYNASKEFAAQAVCRSHELEAGWNCLAVASHMGGDTKNAKRFYEKAKQIVLERYRRGRGWGRDGEHEGGGDGAGDGTDDGDGDGDGDGEEWGGEQMTELSESEKRLTKRGRQVLAALYNNMSILKRQEGRAHYWEASRLLEKSLQLGGENALAYNNLGVLYVSADRLREAEQMMRHAMELDGALECARSNHMRVQALLRQQRAEREREREREP